MIERRPVFSVPRIREPEKARTDLHDVDRLDFLRQLDVSHVTVTPWEAEFFRTNWTTVEHVAEIRAQRIGWK